MRFKSEDTTARFQRAHRRAIGAFNKVRATIQKTLGFDWGHPGKRAFGRIPRTGDSFEWDRYRFEVTHMDGRRVGEVHVTRRPTSALPPPEAQEPHA